MQYQFVKSQQKYSLIRSPKAQETENPGEPATVPDSTDPRP